jgi:hypothetical protein
MSDAVPTLPVYQKPVERKPAVVPQSVATPIVKHPNTLNRLMSRMLKPQMKRISKLQTGKHKKHKFY